MTLNNTIKLEWIDKTVGLHQTFDAPIHLSCNAPEIRLASVLLPLFWHHEQWHLLYIRRVENDRDRHSGQVAFPGGRRDAEDKNAIATALREAKEEIGLQSDVVKVMMTLDDYVTSSSYRVSPVVAIVPWPYDYHAQPSEVGRIFSIPLKWLADPSNLELRRRRLKRGDHIVETDVIYFKRYDGEVLWGASARITVSFLRAIHRRQLVLPDKLIE